MSNLPSVPQLLATPEGITARGRWSAATLGERGVWARLENELAAVQKNQRENKALDWDLRDLQWLDHVGAQALWRLWGRRWPTQLQAHARERALIAAVCDYLGETENKKENLTSNPLQNPPENIQKALKPRVQKRPFFGEVVLPPLYELGYKVLRTFAHARDFIILVGQLFLDLIWLIKNPRLAPWRDFSGHLQAFGATAMGITALVGFLIGVVLAYLMALQLQQFGAQAFIVNILGISLVRELGPLLAAILVAGRSGSAIAAQIGVMRLTQELDAMLVMGIAHGRRLVLPRALALAVAMPLLALWTTLAALVGGMLAADLTMDISAAWFLQSLPAAVDINNLWLAIGKSAVFGIFIALIGCHWGFQIQPNTQSLGAGTTISVVSSITMVIILDAIFAIGFKSVGF